MGRKPTKKGTAAKPSKTKEPQIEGLNEEVLATETKEEPTVEETVAEQPEQEPQTAQKEATEPQEAQTPKEVQEPEKTAENEAVAQLEQELQPKKKHAFSEQLYNVSEKETAEMMNFLGISMLPEHNESDIWMTAVAKVQRRDLSMSWCVLKRLSHDSHTVTKIFGGCSPINRVGRPVPIDTVPYDVAARVIGQGRDYMVKTIHASLKTPIEELAALNDEELQTKVIDTVINEYWQQDERKKEQQKRAETRRFYAERQ